MSFIGRLRFAVLLLGLLPALLLAQTSIDTKLAARYFQEAKWASDDDGGKLWGKRLYGPMLFADPATRTVVANQADSRGALHEEGGVFIGVLPREVAIANTAIEWSGIRWTMVTWGDLAGPEALRVQLMIHECWHRIQSEIGLPPKQEPNAHLDSETGRIWLRLEWRALASALVGIGDERLHALADALTFRLYRRSQFPGVAAQEDRMEVHEGLAEYSGVKLMGLGDWSRGSYVAGRLKIDAVNRPSYPLSFAYDTGPSYGILLDDTGKEWRSKLTPSSSLSQIAQRLYRIALPVNIALAAKTRSAAYGGAEIRKEEKKREEIRQSNERKWRQLLVRGPVLELPIPAQNYSYDPNEIFPVGSDGTVFPESHIADAWGVLEVKNGVRLNALKNVAYVAAPASSSSLSNSHWTLTLSPGWKLVPGNRKGDYRLARS